MSRFVDTSIMRSARTQEQVQVALAQAADALERLAQRVEPAIRADGVLVRDNDTVAINIDLAQQAQHQPVGTVTISGGSGTPTPTLSNIKGAVLDDANTEGASGTVVIPPQWQGTRVSGYITWAHSEAATTGDIRFRLRVLPRALGEDDTATATDVDLTVTAASTNGEYEDGFQRTRLGTFPVGPSDEILLYSMRRRGGAASDTFAASIWAYSLLLINE